MRGFETDVALRVLRNDVWDNLHNLSIPLVSTSFFSNKDSSRSTLIKSFAEDEGFAG